MFLRRLLCLKNKLNGINLLWQILPNTIYWSYYDRRNHDSCTWWLWSNNLLIFVQTSTIMCSGQIYNRQLNDESQMGRYTTHKKYTEHRDGEFAGVRLTIRNFCDLWPVLGRLWNLFQANVFIALHLRTAIKRRGDVYTAAAVSAAAARPLTRSPTGRHGWHRVFIEVIVTLWTVSVCLRVKLVHRLVWLTGDSRSQSADRQTNWITLSSSPHYS